MKKVSVHASIDYDIIIQHGIMKETGKLLSEVARTKKTAIVTDDIVDKLYGKIIEKSLDEAGFEYTKFVFPNGEKSKCAKTLEKIWDFLASSGITRTDSVIALGGGVPGDITGFAAATFLRGVDYIQIPTTLLAQVDSSVGGKTAIDLECGKNLAGAFKQPSLVICDPDTLKTLPPKNFSDGMGEVIKYGMIRDKKLFDTLCNYTQDTLPEIIEDIIATCVSIKRDVVQEDEKDTGIRMILNFGHTLAHSIESYYHYETYTHGSAVAIGMYNMSKRTASDEVTEKLKDCLERYNLPVSCDAPFDELVEMCRNDKKRQNKKINFIACPEIGKAEIRTMNFDDFVKFMEEKN